MLNLLVFFVLVTLAGFAPIFYKQFLSGIDTTSLIVFIAFINFLAALFVYLTNLDTVNSDLGKMTGQTMVLLALLVIATYFIGQFLYMYLLKSNSSFAVASIASIGPVITLLASVFLFKQTVGWPGILGVLLTSAGVGAILYDNMNPK